MEFEAKMRPFLEEVGISDLFEKSKADLSDIADEPLYGLVHLLFQNQILNPKISKKPKKSIIPRTKNVSSLNQSKHSYTNEVKNEKTMVQINFKKLGLVQIILINDFLNWIWISNPFPKSFDLSK